MILSRSALANNSDDNYRQALQALGQIAYKETGLETKVKKLEKKYVPEPVKKYGGYTLILAQIVVNNRISYEWTF